MHDFSYTQGVSIEPTSCCSMYSHLLKLSYLNLKYSFCLWKWMWSECKIKNSKLPIFRQQQQLTALECIFVCSVAFDKPAVKVNQINIIEKIASYKMCYNLCLHHNSARVLLFLLVSFALLPTASTCNSPQGKLANLGNNKRLDFEATVIIIISFEIWVMKGSNEYWIVAQNHQRICNISYFQLDKDLSHNISCIMNSKVLKDCIWILVEKSACNNKVM